MIQLWTAICQTWKPLPLLVEHGQENCPWASARCSSVQLLSECVLRRRWSFYSIFPWVSLSLECLGGWLSGLTRRHRLYNPRCWGYVCPPSHPYLHRCLDYGCRTRCRFRLVSFLCFLLGVFRSERPTRSRIQAAVSLNPSTLYQIPTSQSVT
jgi:hypothetical protein